MTKTAKTDWVKREQRLERIEKSLRNPSFRFVATNWIMREQGISVSDLKALPDDVREAQYRAFAERLFA